MAASLPELVRLTAGALPFAAGMELACNAAQVINDKKVTDHHAVIPTRNLQGADLSGLPVGEKAVLELVALRLLCAVAEPHTYAETAVTVECAGAEFAAKGRTVKQLGWRALDAAYRAGLKNAEPDKEIEDKALPELSEGQTLPLSGAAVKEGKTTPPKHFTEDSLLAAMETAGKDDMPENAERKGLGTPATRAGILEKLVSTGFLERKKSKKTVQLLPSHDAVSLITVLPEQLQSPFLTAEWEYRLGEIERGELSPEDFMAGISAMLQELVRTYQVIKGTEYLFTPPRVVVGKCPPLRRRSCRNAKRLLLSDRILQICNLEKQQVVGAEAQAAHQGHRDSAAQGWPRPCDRPVLRENRQDLRRHRGTGGRWEVRQFQAGI